MRTRPTSLILIPGLMAVVAAACAAGSAVEAGTAPPLAVVEPAAPRSPTTEPQPATTIPETPSPATSTTAAAPIAPVAPSRTTTTIPPAPEPFAVDPDEVHRAAKQLGSEIAQMLTTYEATTPLPELAARVTTDPDRHAALTSALAPLFHSGRWSRGTVIYPQLGGMRDTASSIMVVVRQAVGTGDRPEHIETRTLDIRLRKVDDEWAFSELASAGGTPVPRPADLSPQAIAVLDDPRIQLPDSARWDIHRGHTSKELLQVMSELAERTPYGVVVLATGHPHNVFATNSTSKHTVGRAVDVYRLGDTRVIDDRAEESFTRETLRWLYERGDIYKLGGPWALDGRGGRSFTDIVHQDHLHISVTR